MARTRQRRGTPSEPGPAQPRTAPPPARVDPLRVGAVCLALAVAIWIAYAGVLWSGFVNYDDDLYISSNPSVRQGLSFKSAAWAFTATEVANWHPVTWLSHMLDVELFGLEPGGHHATNLLLHTLNAILLLLLLMNLTGALWRSSLVAFLFALHPLHVESVAWVAERKDVLSTLFWLLTLAAWLAFVRSRKAAWYGCALSLYALGLMSKPMLVTLPFTLLLLDFWPLGRLSHPAGKPPGPIVPLLLEKFPFFILSAASSAVTFLAQRSGGAVQTLEGISVAGRLVNAIWAYAAYLAKTVWPTGLAVFYPLPREGHPAWQVLLGAVLLAGITAWAAGSWRTRPYLTFGWFWYLGTLVPVIGLVQVGSQEMADRYTYVPLIGIFLAFAWGLGALAQNSPRVRGCTVAACGAMLLLLPAATRAQVAVWESSVTLFQRAIAVTADNCVAHNNLGAVLFNAGRKAEALYHLREALRIKPDYSDAHDNLGVALDKMGQHEEAVEHFRLAVRYGSRSAVAIVNLGNALVAEGQLDLAAEQFRNAIRIKPDFPDAHFNLGLALESIGRHAEAEEELRRTLELDPENAEARHHLGKALAAQGRPEEAVPEYGEALRLKPGIAEAHNDLGASLAALGRLDEAAGEYGEAIRIKPDFADAHNNLGLAFAAMGRMPEASAQFVEALKDRPGFADAHNNLGVALARENRIPEAVEQFRAALRAQPDFAKARDNLRQIEGSLPR